jgi:hypothetical protein
VHRLLLVLPILAAAAPVYADPCGDARAELKAKDLARAWIDASACGDETLIADVEARVEKAGYSPVEVVTDPDGGTVVVEPAPDRPFTAPMRVWLPPGRHYVTAMVDGQPVAQTVAVAKNGSRTSALLSLPPPADPAKTGVVDMGEEGGGEMSSGPPPKTEMPSLLPERYQQGVDKRPIAWTDPIAIVRWPQPWQISVGLTAGSGLGGTVGMERAIGRHHWVVVPTAAATLARDDDDTVTQGHAGAMVAWRERMPQAIVYLGAGLGGSITRGGDAVAGAAVEVIAEASYSRRSGLVVGVQTWLPALTTADARFFDVTLFVGRRW